MKKKFILLVIVLLLQTICFSQKTYIGTSGNWSTAANWSPSGVPTSSDDVIIPSGKSVLVPGNAFAKSISLSGILSLNNNVTLTVGTSSLNGNFTVNSGGSFNMPGGSGIATLIVYGNYYNNGTTDFWKSNVIIVGDLLSPSSSALQNQGNIVVGGNIIGAFNLTGGDGTNQIYAINPNASVVITPTSIDNNVPPGSVVTESPLVDLVNSIFFGNGGCTFSINDPISKEICEGSSTVFTVSTAQSNPSFQWQINQGTGWSDLNNGGVYSGATTANLTITAATIAMNGYKYRAKITAGCSKNGNYAVLTVNAVPSVPVTSIIQPTCLINTGTITVAIQNSTDTYSFDNGLTFQASNSKSGLSMGSYNIIVKNSKGCNSPISTLIIAQTTSTWNGTTWTPSVPTINDKIIFNGNYSSTGNLIACSCQVNSGDVVINSGHSLTLTKEINVAGGQITFENSASLVQINSNAVNTGNIKYERNTTPLKLYDFTYWSSPVNNATLSQLATNSAFFAFNPTINNWESLTGSTSMISGKGYIGRAPSNLVYNPTNIVETTFIGVPNNGTITTPIVKASSTSNLIGNPYPSAIDADLFISDPANINNINGTIYLWTHNTAITNNNYTQNDYAKYNLIGGVKTASAALSGGVVPTGKIAAEQGFFVEANTNLTNGNYSVVFNNTMRIANSNNQFFKSSQEAISTLEKHRFWVSLSTAQGAYNEFLVGYVQNATNDFDTLFDGKTLASGNSVSIYTLLGSDNLAIQGRSLPFNDNDSIPIGYSTTYSGELTINLEDYDGLFSNQNIYLYDAMTGIYNDIKSGSYSFITNSGTFNNRFEIRFLNTSLTTVSNSTSENDVVITNINNEVIFTSKNDLISKIEIYDILGNLLSYNEDLNANLFKINSSKLYDKILIIKVILDNDKIVTKKHILINK